MECSEKALALALCSKNMLCQRLYLTADGEFDRMFFMMIGNARRFWASTGVEIQTADKDWGICAALGDSQELPAHLERVYLSTMLAFTPCGRQRVFDIDTLRCVRNEIIGSSDEVSLINTTCLYFSILLGIVAILMLGAMIVLGCMICRKRKSARKSA